MEAEIKKCLEVLRGGGALLYPTDTVWGIGCDAANVDAVKKVYALKKREESKALIVLLANEEELERYVDRRLPDAAKRMAHESGRPVTVVYPKARNLAANLIASDGSIAIRIPNMPFCQRLLRAFGGAIVSTSANVSGEPTPQNFGGISELIKKGASHVVNPDVVNTQLNAKPSIILKIDDESGACVVLRA